MQVLQAQQRMQFVPMEKGVLTLHRHVLGKLAAFPECEMLGGMSRGRCILVENGRWLTGYQQNSSVETRGQGSQVNLRCWEVSYAFDVDKAPPQPSVPPPCIHPRTSPYGRDFWNT